MCRCWPLPSENTGCKKCFVSLVPKYLLSNCGIQNCKWRTLSKRKPDLGEGDGKQRAFSACYIELQGRIRSDRLNFIFLRPALDALSLSSFPCWSRSPLPPDRHLSCDMNINTPLGLMNTRMIKTYVAIDPRVRPFAMIIKHWARKRVLNDAGMEDSCQLSCLCMLLLCDALTLLLT